ncbi:hypothetical protein BH10BAC3_BH10BAC3_01480 [soil metagenome]
MKKISILLFVAFIGFTGVKAQNISFTIKPGSDANSAKVFIKSNADITGVVSQILVTFILPASVNPTAPTSTITTNAAFPQWGGLSLTTPVPTETVNGVSSYIYTYFAAPLTSTTTTFTNGVEVLLGEISFAPGTSLSDLKLASLAAGGTSSISYLVIEVGGTVISNTIALTYGTGAVNTEAGFDGLSYVPLGPILPVKFLSFYALKSGEDAKLSWTVSSDDENKYFDIERSTNGRGFTSFTRVNAYENGQSTNTYEAADLLISKNGSKDLYYRIKQVDKSGATVYSVIRNLNIYQSSLGISLYPNPSRSVSKLIVDAPAPSKAIVILRDFTGKQIQVMNLQFVKGINQKDINVSNLPAGDYNVSVVSENLNQTIKLSKLK